MVARASARQILFEPEYPPSCHFPLPVAAAAGGAVALTAWSACHGRAFAENAAAAASRPHVYAVSPGSGRPGDDIDAAAAFDACAVLAAAPCRLLP